MEGNPETPLSCDSDKSVNHNGDIPVSSDVATVPALKDALNTPDSMRPMLKTEAASEDEFDTIGSMKVTSKTSKTVKEDDSDTSDSIETTVKNEDDFKAPADIPFKKPIFISRTMRLNTKCDETQSNRSTAEKENKNIISESVNTSKLLEKSPAQKLIEKAVPIPYKEPTWSGLPPADYSFEVLKNGTIVEVISLNKPFSVVGRLAQCDIVMEHPSLSRFHCVIQYRLEASETHPQGFYAYDLGSTHGSFHNKHPMKPHTYYRLRVGHMLKFGCSTRMLILQGPQDDQEPESELTVSELMAKAAERAKKLDQLETGELEEVNLEKPEEESKGDEKPQVDTEGVDWGMGEDAEEEPEEEENPFASLNEELYLDDPKKTLRGWFEREGYDLPNYVTDDLSPGFYRCKVELPIPGPGNGPLVAIIEHRGKKKEAVIQCALEACRLLDRQGVLRQAKHESHERKKRDWAENDYYDSEEDDFLDRTGDVQRKRIRRMKDAGGKDSAFVENYDTLITKYSEVVRELATLEEKLAEADFLKQASKGNSGADDDLDAYLNKLKSQVPDKHKRVTWKLRAVDLRKDELRLRRLANIARPLGVPEMQPYEPKYEPSSSKQSLKPESLGAKRKEAMKSAFLSTQPKIFMEEEPEQKPRLRRLDDDDDDEPPVRFSQAPARKGKPPRQNIKYDKIKKSELGVPGSSDSKTNKYNKSSLVEFIKDESLSRKVLAVKESELPSPDLHHAGKSNVSGNDSKLNKDREIVHAVGNHTQHESNNNDEAEGNSSSGDITICERSNISKISPSKDLSSENIQDSPSEKKLRIIGPSLPLHLAHLKTGHQDRAGKRKKQEKSRKYDEDNPNYDTWTPPQRQSGDGRTKLNEKLGY
nr:kanadaptin-like isoform X2 [Procambarus clarkii]